MYETPKNGPTGYKLFLLNQSKIGLVFLSPKLVLSFKQYFFLLIFGGLSFEWRYKNNILATLKTQKPGFKDQFLQQSWNWSKTGLVNFGVDPPKY